ncbi:MAG: response regulator [Deltaproteobacteria bacterium]|nr:response regulator [Deltaproteobacteria bacterium]
MENVLLIEDDDDFRNLLKIVMENADYAVTEASNGLEGCRIFQKDFHKLVITDIFMPDKEGIETILEIRSVDPDVKIMAISGGGQSGSIDMLSFARDLGADAIMTKPIDLKDLMRKVAGLIGKESSKKTG